MNNNILQNPRRSNSTPSTLLSKSELSKNLLANNLKPYPQYSNVNLSQPTFARMNTESYKLGYNYRKSNYLKKYCECFQASIYCSPSCHCNDCKNLKGNATRERLIIRIRKQEERECMVLASVYATGGNSSATLRPASIGVNRRVTTQENSALSGNDCGGQAEVLVKGVAARGIDRFLPP